MEINPALKELGFSKNDRVLIIHPDDIGMCQATIGAYTQMVAFGLISSAATMPVCPWFLEAVEFFREHPEVDLGVHLTLTSEWMTYRWGPVSTRDLESGLLDAEGYFHHRQQQVQEFARPEAVKREIRAQFEKALQAGLEPSHIDSHMFALVHSKFVAFYLELALEQRLPLLLMRSDEAWQNLGIKLDRIEMLRAQLPVLEEQGLPLFDHLVMMPLDYHENRVEVAKELLSTLKDGLNIFLCHPALDTPELKTIVPHQWRARFGDFQIMMSEEIKKYIKEEGIQVIGYRHLKELMQRS